jgi:hypothetical protein
LFPVERKKPGGSKAAKGEEVSARSGYFNSSTFPFTVTVNVAPRCERMACSMISGKHFVNLFACSQSASGPQLENRGRRTDTRGAILEIGALRRDSRSNENRALQVIPP